MIVIDYQNRKPIYEQIVEKFQMLIIKGILKADSQMPSVRTLASELSINPNTIQKAYTILEQQGYIYPVKGRGNFVSGNQALKKKKEEVRASFLAPQSIACKECFHPLRDISNIADIWLCLPCGVRKFCY